MRTALVLACDDRFIPFTALVARRLAALAAESHTVVVVSDGVSDENKQRAQLLCPQIEFVEASPFLDGRTLRADDKITRAAHLRLFLDQILADFDRAIYLDSDISPLVDVSPLLATRLTSAPIAAVYDFNLMAQMSYRERLGMTGPYFNSGVLAIDLKAVRTERIFEQAIRYAGENAERCMMHDQDALNAVLDGRWQVLDWRWNVMNYLSELLPRKPFIRHFAGNKPWTAKKTGVEPAYVDQWRADLGGSPWPDRFEEEAPRQRITAFAGAAAATLGQGYKSWRHADAPGKRGNRARLINGLPAILSRVEDQAAAEAQAEWPSFIRLDG